MTDIVERLSAFSEMYPTLGPLFEDAAYEIERLRKQVKPVTGEQLFEAANQANGIKLKWLDGRDFKWNRMADILNSAPNPREAARK